MLLAVVSVGVLAVGACVVAPEVVVDGCNVDSAVGVVDGWVVVTGDPVAADAVGVFVTEVPADGAIDGCAVAVGDAPDGVVEG